MLDEANLNYKIFAKTGWEGKYGWYVGYGPTEAPEYVCVCCIEEGGSGALCAAPAVRSVLAAAFGLSAEHVSGSATEER